MFILVTILKTERVALCVPNDFDSKRNARKFLTTRMQLKYISPTVRLF